MDKIIILAGALLVLYAVWQTVQRFRGRAKSSCCGGAEAPTRKTVADTDETHYPYRYRLAVGGMHCSHCAVNVENALNAMPGVWGRVNLSKNEADVRTKKPVVEAAFAETLRDAGYALNGYTDLSPASA